MSITKATKKAAKVTVHAAPPAKKGTVGKVWNFAKRHPVPVAAALAVGVGAAVVMLRTRRGKAAKKPHGAPKARRSATK